MNYYKNKIRTMIIGAGSAAKMLMKEIYNSKNSPYIADKIAAEFDTICIVDNDPKKLGMVIYGNKISALFTKITKKLQKNYIKKDAPYLWNIFF